MVAFLKILSFKGFGMTEVTTVFFDSYTPLYTFSAKYAPNTGHSQPSDQSSRLALDRLFYRWACCHDCFETMTTFVPLSRTRNTLTRYVYYAFSVSGYRLGRVLLSQQFLRAKPSFRQIRRWKLVGIKQNIQSKTGSKKGDQLTCWTYFLNTI